MWRINTYYGDSVIITLRNAPVPAFDGEIR